MQAAFLCLHYYLTVKKYLLWAMIEGVKLNEIWMYSLVAGHMDIAPCRYTFVN
jgi:hypothetical protein